MYIDPNWAKVALALNLMLGAVLALWNLAQVEKFKKELKNREGSFLPRWEMENSLWFAQRARTFWFIWAGASLLLYLLFFFRF